MSGTRSAGFVPLSVGQTDTGDLSAWLGRPAQIDDSVYVVCQAASAIASGSNGKALVSPVTTGTATAAPSYSVSLSTTTGSKKCCGAIPSTLTGPIAASAYFLALRDGVDALFLTSTGASSIDSGTLLMTGTGGDFIMMTTGVAFADLENRAASCGWALTVHTGGSGITGSISCHFHAPFRGA